MEFIPMYIIPKINKAPEHSAPRQEGIARCP